MHDRIQYTRIIHDGNGRKTEDAFAGFADINESACPIRINCIFINNGGKMPDKILHT
jgi:hypothetical protein